MKINGIKNITKTIYILDKHIENILKEKEFDMDRLDILTRVRTEYIQELNWN